MTYGLPCALDMYNDGFIGRSEAIFDLAQELDISYDDAAKVVAQFELDYGTPFDPYEFNEPA